MRIKKLIKGILLSLVFAAALNLNAGEINHKTTDTQVAGIQQEVFVSSVYAQDVDMDFTGDESAQTMTPEEYAAQEDLLNGGTSGGSGGENVNLAAEAVDAKLAKLREQEKQAWNSSSAIRELGEKLTLLHRLFHPLINFFAFQIGGFLGNDYIYQGDMGDMIKSIWILSRNIVNIVFVLILLFIALKEIFDLRGGGDGGDLKKNLMKFTLLLVAVNFSWMATKIVLDASNVATTVVFAMPMGVSNAAPGVSTLKPEPCAITMTGKKTEGQCVPTAVFKPLDADPSNYQYIHNDQCKGDDLDKIKDGYDDAYMLFEGIEGADEQIIENVESEYHGKTTICWDNLSFIKYNKNNATVYLTYGMARIQNIINASSNGIIKLTISTLMSILIQAAYTVALAALFIALIFRMAVLWIFVAFSPILFIFFYFKGFGDVGGGEFSFGPKKFFHLAFVPAYVGAIFSVSFLMLAAGQKAGYIGNETVDSVGAGGLEVTNNVMMIQSVFAGMETYQEFIWLLIVIIILWMGVFGILKDVPGASMITERIKGWGSELGKFIAKSPALIKFIPMKDKDGNTQMTSLGKLAKTIDPVRLAKQFEKDSLDIGDLAKGNEAANTIKADEGKQKAIVDAIDQHGKNNPERALEKVVGVIGHGWTVQKALEDPDGMKSILDHSGDDVQAKASEILSIIKKVEKKRGKVADDEARAEADKKKEEEEKADADKK